MTDISDPVPRLRIVRHFHNRRFLIQPLQIDMEDLMIAQLKEAIRMETVRYPALGISSRVSAMKRMRIRARVLKVIRAETQIHKPLTESLLSLFGLLSPLPFLPLSLLSCDRPFL